MARGDPDVPSPDELEAAGARIGSIGIERVDVFDRSQKGENHFLGRLTNVLHIETRDGVVRRELLFHEGDLFRQALLDETARNIRQLGSCTTSASGPSPITTGSSTSWSTSRTTGRRASPSGRSTSAAPPRPRWSCGS
ncbi:MAG: hypothetical protein U0166_13085 [Acidobacteriota bacterium]